MNRQLRVISGVVLFGVTIALQCRSDPARRVDRLFRAYQGNQPGAVVMVIRQGKPVLVKTYGMADLAAGRPVRSHTNFRLASITKQFTALSIMILKERGRLGYEQSLTDILPDFPAYGRAITVRHLLQHTSGLVDYEDLIPDTATAQVLDRDVLRLMMAQDSTYFKPGTQFRYSNSGYAMLAMIVERLSGRSFAEFLQHAIFAPLGMTNSVAFEKGVSDVAERAFGYHVEAGSVRFSDQSLTSAVLGDGGIYSSIDDLRRWDQALETDQLVSRATLREAWTPNLEHYGFGWYIDAWRGHTRCWHTGSTCGFRNAMMRFPDDQLTIIILTNRREPDVANLAEQIAEWYLD